MAAIALSNHHRNHILPKVDANMDLELNITSATEMFHHIAAQSSQPALMAPPLPSSSPFSSAQDPADRPLDMEAIDRSMTFHPSFGYTISVGTVTMDFKQNKVLCIWNKKLKIFQLPKGRKNIGEGFLEGAIRETYEETGVRVKPLPLKISTRATQPATEIVGKSPQVTHGVVNTEFVGAVHYPDPQSDAPAIKSMFYFAAESDSTVPPDRGTTEAYEKLDTHWLPVAEVPGKLRFQAEIGVVQKALRDAINFGYQIDSLEQWRPTMS